MRLLKLKPLAERGCAGQDQEVHVTADSDPSVDLAAARPVWLGGRDF